MNSAKLIWNEWIIYSTFTSSDHAVSPLNRLSFTSPHVSPVLASTVGHVCVWSVGPPSKLMTSVVEAAALWKELFFSTRPTRWTQMHKLVPGSLAATVTSMHVQNAKSLIRVWVLLREVNPSCRLQDMTQSDPPCQSCKFTRCLKVAQHTSSTNMKTQVFLIRGWLVWWHQ